MPYPIEKKLVVAVASSALFDLTESHKVYREQGVELYRNYQDDNIDVCFEKENGIPFLTDSVTNKKNPISITHHGRYWKGIILKI